MKTQTQKLLSQTILLILIIFGFISIIAIQNGWSPKNIVCAIVSIITGILGGIMATHIGIIADDARVIDSVLVFIIAIAIVTGFIFWQGTVTDIATVITTVAVIIALIPSTANVIITYKKEWSWW